MRDVRSDTGDRVAIGVVSVPLNIDVNVENTRLLDKGDAKVQFSDGASDAAAARVSCTMSCVAGIDIALFIVDVMWLASTTNDVQSCSQAMIAIIR